MAANTLDFDFARLGADGYVSAEDVLFLRRNVYPDGVVSAAELSGIFALGEKARGGDPEWAAFFAEAVADYYLNEEEPRGHLTDAEFADLKARVTRDSAHASSLELGVLVRLTEIAITVPASLSAFVRTQIARVIAGKRGGPVINATDVDLIRRALYASGGDGAIGITTPEAELLFDLHDLTAQSANDPAWTVLFKQAICAYLMRHVGYQPVAREEAVRRESWLANRTGNPLRFIAAMFGSRPPKVEPSVWGEKLNHDAIGTATAEQITGNEADWLADRIGRNGAFDAAERAILEHLATLTADLPPKLKALAARAA